MRTLAGKEDLAVLARLGPDDVAVGGAVMAAWRVNYFVNVVVAFRVGGEDEAAQKTSRKTVGQSFKVVHIEDLDCLVIFSALLHAISQKLAIGRDADDLNRHPGAGFAGRWINQDLVPAAGSLPHTNN